MISRPASCNQAHLVDSLLREEREASSLSRFRELGLLDPSGKPRLNYARGYFFRAENSLDLLEELYVYWRDFHEYLVLRSEHVNAKTWSSEWKYVAVKCSKRGNDIYVSRVKRRLNWLGNGENVYFFDISDFKPNKKVLTSALWVTLTYDTKRCSRFEAWEKQIGIDFNCFISALRRKYGKISVLRTWEATEKGFPHVHAILLFHDFKFSVFPHLIEDHEGREKLTFRIHEKAEVASYWHSHVDVQAISSTKKLFNYMRKYQTKVLLASDSEKGVSTMALMWLFRKRGFSVSGDFRSKLSDLIRLMRNSNMELRQCRLDGSFEDRRVWEFVGVFSGVELSIHSFLWFVCLNRDQVRVVLAKESGYS